MTGQSFWHGVLRRVKPERAFGKGPRAEGQEGGGCGAPEAPSEAANEPRERGPLGQLLARAAPDRPPSPRCAHGQDSDLGGTGLGGIRGPPKGGCRPSNYLEEAAAAGRFRGVVPPWAGAAESPFHLPQMSVDGVANDSCKVKKMCTLSAPFLVAGAPRATSGCRGDMRSGGVIWDD